MLKNFNDMIINAIEETTKLSRKDIEINNLSVNFIGINNNCINNIFIDICIKNTLIEFNNSNIMIELDDKNHKDTIYLYYGKDKYYNDCYFNSSLLEQEYFKTIGLKIYNYIENIKKRVNEFEIVEYNKKDFETPF